MPDFAVTTRFKAKDMLSGVFKRMGRNADSFGDRTSAAFGKAARSGSQFRTIVGGILAAGAVQRSISGLTMGLRSASSEFLTFDQAIISASAKFSDLNLSTKQGRQQLEGLKQTARDVGASTQFSASEAAQGLDFLAMAGFNTQQAMAALPGVVDLATVAGVDLARATDIASDSLGAFGLMTKDSGQLAKNFSRVNDVMAKTMTRTNTTMEQLFEGAKKGAPAFTAAGQSVESFNTLMGIMANSGVKGEEAGTQLRNMMLRLSDPTSKAAKVLDRLNVRVQDQAGNFRDAIDIIADFEKGLKGMGSQQRSAALSTVFGARAVTGINLLLQEGSGRLREFRQELINSAGSSKSMAGIMRGSLLNRLASLKSALIELAFKIFTDFEKQGGKALDNLTAAVREFNVQPIIDGLKIAIGTVKMLAAVIKPLIPLIKFLTANFIVYHSLLKAQKIYDTIKDFKQMAVAIRATSGVMGILNAVMAANPIAVIALAITGFIALLIWLEKRFNIFSDAFDYWSSKFLAFKDIIKNIVTPALELLNNPLLFLTKRFNLFTDAFDFWVSKFSSFKDLIGSVKTFFGMGGAPEPADVRERRIPIPPNRREAEARRQQIQFNGRLQIAGAPPGSTVESETRGAPPLELELFGGNP